MLSFYLGMYEYVYIYKYIYSLLIKFDFKKLIHMFHKAF